jgi:hypothetical protein
MSLSSPTEVLRFGELSHNIFLHTERRKEMGSAGDA